MSVKSRSTREETTARKGLPMEYFGCLNSEQAAALRESVANGRQRVEEEIRRKQAARRALF